MSGLRMLRHLLNCAALFALAAVCLPAQNLITLLLTNAKIWTGNEAQPEAQAVAINGNRIVAVGTTEEILRLKQPSTALLDLGGRRMVPGFNDAHVHLFEGGSSLTGPQLRYSKSQKELRDTLAEYVKNKPRGQWITGGDWDHENWTPATLPTHELIDNVTRNWPVFVNRLDGHMALANALALKLAGIDRNTKDPPGGLIVRDANGDPTGILKDNAQALVRKVIPPPTQQQIIDASRAAQSYANAQGVTSVQDMVVAPDVLQAYQTMLHEGMLHVRISAHQLLTNWQRLAEVGIKADFGNEYLHIGGVKGFADGSLGSTTAWFFQPYVDAPNTTGIPVELSDPEKMWRNMEGADATGLQIAVHAIGDRANDTILNMYERLEREHGERDRRLRIEHAQHLIPEDIPRFAKLHVIASMQPYHCIDDGRWAEKRVGPERIKTMYVFRSLLNSGATLAFGSDWDVAPMSPLMGIYAAVTRRTLDGKHPGGWNPSEKITVEEAVRAYTAGSAYASFDEKIKGTIEPGKLADFAVLSDDIFTIDPVKIADTKVYLTVFDGKIVTGPEPSPYQKLPSGLLLRP